MKIHEISNNPLNDKFIFCVLLNPQNVKILIIFNLA